MGKNYFYPSLNKNILWVKMIFPYNSLINKRNHCFDGKESNRNYSNYKKARTRNKSIHTKGGLVNWKSIFFIKKIFFSQL